MDKFSGLSRKCSESLGSETPLPSVQRCITCFLLRNPQTLLRFHTGNTAHLDQVRDGLVGLPDRVSVQLFIRAAPRKFAGRT